MLIDVRPSNDINDPSKLARFSLLAGGPIGLPLRASNEDINDPSKLARFSLLAGGPIGLPLRASNEHILIAARCASTGGRLVCSLIYFPSLLLILS